MTLPIVWAGQSVSNANLQDATGGPWARIVDGNLGSNTGRNYTNLQDAWDAASPGDSIFVKGFAYAGGLQVSTIIGNAKDGIRVVGESSGNEGADGVPKWNATLSVQDCNNLTLENLAVDGNAGADGFFFGNVDRYLLRNLHSRASAGDAFEATIMRRGYWENCTARTAAGRGFVFYDTMQRNAWIGCQAEANGSHGWSIGAFPTSNDWCVFNGFYGCQAFDNTGSGHGFGVALGSPASGARGWQHLAMVGCEAAGNAGDGYRFDDISAAGVNSNGIRLVGNNAYANGSFGYRLVGVPASNPEMTFTGNTAQGNVGGQYTGFPATLLPGYIGRGLSAPGTNS